MTTKGEFDSLRGAIHFSDNSLIVSDQSLTSLRNGERTNRTRGNYQSFDVQSVTKI